MNLRVQVLTGLYWSGGARLVSQLCTWAITIVVMRLLEPADYGLLAMATVFGSFLAIFGQAGLGTALVQAPEVDDRMLRRIFGAVILINSALFLLQYAAAPAIAHIFNEDRLTAIVRVLGIQFLVSVFAVIPGALLARNLDFKRQSIIDLASVVCGSLLTLWLAMNGYGVWALVAGGLFASALGTLAMNVIVPSIKWPDFSMQGMRGLIAFGSQVTGARLLWTIYSQADTFIAGKMLGKELLGFYSVSMHLATLPMKKVASILNGIAFPAFARTQQDPGEVRRLMLKMVRVLSLFAFPIAWGISGVAPEIIGVFLGAKWSAAILPLQLLPLIMPLTMIGTLLSSAFQGIGYGKVVLVNALTATLVMPIAFLIGAQWGLLGLSIAWLVAYPLVFLANLRRMLPLVGLTFIDLFSAVARAALSGAVMYALIEVCRFIAADAFGAPLLLAFLVGAGAIAYAGIALTVNRASVDEVTELFDLHRLRRLLRTRS